MIPISNLTLLIIWILATLTFITLMLLPAIYELKKPKDAGPRRITENPTRIEHQTQRMLIILDEDDVNPKTVSVLSEILVSLPNLET
ncbi:MAG: hypothetical protein QW667_01765 [Candidatus Bathyarchaeia archaeon]